MKKRSIISFIIVAIFLLLTLSTQARSPIRTVEGTVTKVSDGDTIQVTTAEGTKIKVRLYGMDAPETEKENKRTGKISKSGQPYGNEAEEYLSSMINRKNVRLDIMDIDRYRRMVAIVWLNENNINLEMIKAGMAEAYQEYIKDQPYRSQFIQAEKDAKSKKIGIWSQSSYERPADFRKRLRVRGD